MSTLATRRNMNLAYEKHATPLKHYDEYTLLDMGSRMLIARNGVNKRSTVAMIETVEQWDRFTAALDSGADEVAAVHAIDREVVE